MHLLSTLAIQQCCAAGMQLTSYLSTGSGVHLEQTPNPRWLCHGFERARLLRPTIDECDREFGEQPPSGEALYPESELWASVHKPVLRALVGTSAVARSQLPYYTFDHSVAKPAVGIIWDPGVPYEWDPVTSTLQPSFFMLNRPQTRQV